MNFFQELGRHSCLASLDLSCNPLQNAGQRVLLLQVCDRLCFSSLPYAAFNKSFANDRL